MSDCGGGKIVKGNKQHRCEACFAIIPKGEIHHHYSGRWEGEWQNWRMHVECFYVYHEDGMGEFTPGSFETPKRLQKLPTPTT